MPTDFSGCDRDSLERLAGDLTAECIRLRAENAALRADLLSARRAADQMIPTAPLDLHRLREWEG